MYMTKKYKHTDIFIGNCLCENKQNCKLEIYTAKYAIGYWLNNNTYPNGR